MTDVRHRLLCGLLTAVTLSATGCTSPATAPSASRAPEATASTESTTASAPLPLAEAMREWKTAAGDHFTASAKALQQVAEASAADDEESLRAGCTQLHDANVVGLQRDLPSPDPMLTDELQRMIDDINTATHACLRFVLARKDVDAANYREYLARAVEHLHRAKTILDADLAPK